MKIGPGPSLPSLYRRPSHSPISPSSDQAELSSHPGPLRDPASFTNWQREYEAQLGVPFTARQQALQQGGPEMLFRMYPQRYFEDFQGPYQHVWGGSAPSIPLHGDCHLGNFGSLRHEDDELLWSLNDYDQGGTGRPEYDLGRAATSLVLRARQNDWPSGELVKALCHHYGKGLEQPPSGPLGLSKKDSQEPVHELLKKAAKRSQSELLEEWTEKQRFRLSEKLQAPTSAQSSRVEQLLEQAGVSRVDDVAVRSEAGGSSLGLERYWVLSQGRILELKQVLPSALSGKGPNPQQADNQVLRDSFRQLHAPKDPFQKILQAEDSVFLLRERQRGRDSLKLERLEADQLKEVAKQMGYLLGQAHALSGSKARSWFESQSDLSERVDNFAQHYARQVEEDFLHCMNP